MVASIMDWTLGEFAMEIVLWIALGIPIVILAGLGLYVLLFFLDWFRDRKV